VGKRQKPRPRFDVMICLGFWIVLIGVVALVSALVLRAYTHTVLSNAVDANLASITEIASDLEDFRLDCDADANLLLAQPDIRTLIERGDEVSDEETFRDAVEQLRKFNKQRYIYLSQITLYTLRGAVFRYGTLWEDLDPALRQGYYDRAFKYAADLTYLGFNPENGKYEFIKLVYDDTYSIRGFLYYQFDRGMMRDTIIGDNATSADAIYIVDDQGMVQYSQLPDELSRPLPDVYRSVTNGRQGYNEANGQVLFYRYSRGAQIEGGRNAWLILLARDRNALYKPVNRALGNVLRLVVVILLVGLALTALIAYIVIRPVNRLKDAMRRVTQHGELSVRVGQDGMITREFCVLADSFNYMLMHIRQLVEDVGQERFLVQKMQRQVLQNQLGAHFLSNALQLIGLQALDIGADDMYASVSSLGYLVSECLKSGDPLATIDSEVRYTQRYFDLMRAKYEDKIRFELRMDEALRSYYVPRFMLQPLVENAVRHGIAPSLGRGCVLVDIRACTSGVECIVEDNGQGMEEKQLAALRTALAEAGLNGTPAGEHVGLRNLYRRLMLVFQDQWSFEISSERYGGTRVRIVLPLLSNPQRRPLAPN
jgi:sensor histidine kinase YesM